MLIHPARMAMRLMTATTIQSSTPWIRGRGPTLRSAAGDKVAPTTVEAEAPDAGAPAVAVTAVPPAPPAAPAGRSPAK